MALITAEYDFNKNIRFTVEGLNLFCQEKTLCLLNEDEAAKPLRSFYDAKGNIYAFSFRKADAGVIEFISLQSKVIYQ